MRPCVRGSPPGTGLRTSLLSSLHLPFAPPSALPSSPTPPALAKVFWGHPGTPWASLSLQVSPRALDVANFCSDLWQPEQRQALGGCLHPRVAPVGLGAEGGAWDPSWPESLAERPHAGRPGDSWCGVAVRNGRDGSRPLTASTGGLGPLEVPRSGPDPEAQEAPALRVCDGETGPRGRASEAHCPAGFLSGLAPAPALSALCPAGMRAAHFPC